MPVLLRRAWRLAARRALGTIRMTATRTCVGSDENGKFIMGALAAFDVTVCAKERCGRDSGRKSAGPVGRLQSRRSDDPKSAERHRRLQLTSHCFQIASVSVGFGDTRVA